MRIDPVVLLVEDLRLAEAALDKAAEIYKTNGSREHGELVNMLLARVGRLFNDLFETAPTSALGAAELVRIVAKRLPFSHSRYTAHLHEIADRLSAGQRIHSDLIWLRAMQGGLAEGLYGTESAKAAPLLILAISGAARPVVIFRAVHPVPGAKPWKAVLAVRPS